jgi:hypothetical protein
MDERTLAKGMLSVLMRGVEEAMRDEGVAAETRERVVNRLVWGEPEGLRAVRNADPDEHVALGGKSIELFDLRP